MGDRLDNIRRAIVLLEESGVKVLRTSSIYETAPVGFQADTLFLNAVFECETSLQPLEVLQLIHEIESQLGRTRNVELGYASRPMDLDILLFGPSVINTQKLHVPHPEMSGRRFVMEPLNELVPNLLHPVTQLPIAHLYRLCTDENKSIIFHKPLSVPQ